MEITGHSEQSISTLLKEIINTDYNGRAIINIFVSINKSGEYEKAELDDTVAMSGGSHILYPQPPPA